MARTVSGRRLEEAGLVMLVMLMSGSFPRPAGTDLLQILLLSFYSILYLIKSSSLLHCYNASFR